MDDKDQKQTSIANRLRLARNHSGLSQYQIAKIMDMHRPTVSEIEAGRRQVTASELKMFADAYEVSVEWILGNDLGNDDTDMDKIQLAARNLSKLKKEDLDTILNLLKALRRDEKK